MAIKLTNIGLSIQSLHNQRHADEDRIVGRMIRELVQFENCKLDAATTRSMDAVCSKAIAEARVERLDVEYIERMARRMRLSW